MLSQTATYALRAVLHIADNGAERPVPVGDIARALDVPRNYLSKTLHQLARIGVVTSTFGPGGGFQLGVPAEVLTLDVVVDPFGTAGERHCLLGGDRCGDQEPCPAHASWKIISEQIHAFFATTTIADLLRGAEIEHVPLRASRRPSPRKR
ncbi:MAG: Rrf2 family transcriptional regulator [Gemmatimonadaceae bacterium]|nr:Rrf2 family transcriptional regulator [Gemmatimonadaceae bacterium]